MCLMILFPILLSCAEETGYNGIEKIHHNESASKFGYFVGMPYLSRVTAGSSEPKIHFGIVAQSSLWASYPGRP